MSFDLFESKASASSPAAKEPETPQGVAATVAKYYEDGLKRAIADLELMESLRGNDYGEGFSPFSDVYRDLPHLNHMHMDLFRAIVAGARKTGLAAAGDFRIVAEDFEKFVKGMERRGGSASGSKIRVDIAGLCNAIEKEFGGKAGELLEHKRVANSLISEFNLRQTEIVEVKGMVELRMRRYLRKSYSGRYELDYSDGVRYGATLENLRGIFGRAGMYLDALPLTNFLRDHARIVEPGKTVFELSIGGQPLRIKIHKEESRWRFPKACVDLLADYVAEHGDAVE
jgi:hypothetical protein